MSYDLTDIAISVRLALVAKPALSLKEISCHLGVDRHTAQRALKRLYGLGYRAVQGECLVDHMKDTHLDSAKGVAIHAGYSDDRALSRRLRQLKGCTTAEFLRKLRVARLLP